VKTSRFASCSALMRLANSITPSGAMYPSLIKSFEEHVFGTPALGHVVMGFRRGTSEGCARTSCR
jgi:hypothetical protein